MDIEEEDNAPNVHTVVISNTWSFMTQILRVIGPLGENMIFQSFETRHAKTFYLGNLTKLHLKAKPTDNLMK